MYTDNSGKKSPRVLWEGTVDNATEARVVSVRYPMMDNIAEVVPEELRKNAMGEMVWWRATDAVTAARIMERAILGLEDRVIAAEAGLERLRVIAEGAFKQHVEAQKPPALETQSASAAASAAPPVCRPR